MTNKKIDMVFDMETKDPDDFITLVFLLGHPDVNLKAVTLVPGTPHQVGLVRMAIDWFDDGCVEDCDDDGCVEDCDDDGCVEDCDDECLCGHIPVGVFNADKKGFKDKRYPGDNYVSDWHYEAFFDAEPSMNFEDGYKVLINNCDENTTLVTGGPLSNVAKALEHGLTVKEIVIQGGFAGDGVVPPGKQMEKFRGLKSTQTFNLNCDKASAKSVLQSDIPHIYMVSKNVCHSVKYDEEFHKLMYNKGGASLSDIMVRTAMTKTYVKKGFWGKNMHDCLAAVCGIDHSVGTWKRVDVYNKKDKWGCFLNEESKIQIIVDYDKDQFFDVLLRSSEYHDKMFEQTKES